jgi:hypothetical protein
MKHRVLFALALLVVAGPAFAQKAYIDYDRDYDFDSIKTFAWAETSETSVEKTDPLLHSRIVNGIEYYLAQAGFTEVTDNPDVYVTYHTSSKEELSLNTSHFGYGYPGGMAWGGYYGHYGYGYGGFSSSSTTVSSYQIGTLVVDVWDAKSKKLVWRGTAGNITVTDNPTRMGKRVDKALAKIVKASQNIKAKAEKAAAKGK